MSISERSCCRDYRVGREVTICQMVIFVEESSIVSTEPQGTWRSKLSVTGRYFDGRFDTVPVFLLPWIYQFILYKPGPRDTLINK